MGQEQEQDLVSTPQVALQQGLPALVLGNICLAFGPLFVRIADTGPVASAFWRISLAVPFLFLIARTVGGPATKIRSAMMGLFLISGMFFAADLAAWHIGILQTKLANANLLGNSTSFLLPLYAFVIARQWPTRHQIAAMALAAIGTTLLLGRSFELSPANFVGDLLCLVAGAFYTGYLILMGHARQTLGQWPVLAWSTLLSAPPLLILAIVMHERLIPIDWTPLIALAFLSQIAGQGLMIYAVGRIAPLLFGLTLLLQPMISALAGWLVFAETFGMADWAGAGLIGLALVLVSQPDRKPV